MKAIRLNKTEKNDFFNSQEVILYNPTNSDIKINVILQNNILSIEAESDVDFSMDKINIQLDYKYHSQDKVFVNGYQSWTDSFEYSLSDRMYRPAPLMRLILNSNIGRKSGLSSAGDMHIVKPNNKKGVFYGFSYGYIRTNNHVNIYGSLSEKIGYTIIEFDTAKGKINVSVDLKGKLFKAGKSCVLKVGKFSGEYDNAFDEYFNAMNINIEKKPILTGYTTWYNYYRNITQKIVKRDLEAICRLNKKIDIFQIDDGYQLAIGDWLNCVKDKFPDGMQEMASLIHSKDMLAGLWLAPFAVTKDCFIYAQHKDWLIKDDKGKLIKSGANWGGFYSLDIYNEEVRDYLRKVFDTILNVWKYDLVKLDFLYCVSIVPIHGKSRGEIMCDAMDFLRECVGQKLILGCGVPLAPAFGKVDYCRIGPDVGLNFGKNRYDSREGVSSKHAILNSVFRRHLDNRAFGNDPDVFLLRENNIHMNEKQKNILAHINKLCGRVLFTSDNVLDYDQKKLELINNIFDKKTYKIKSACYEKGVLTIVYFDGAKTNTINVKV